MKKHILIAVTLCVSQLAFAQAQTAAPVAVNSGLVTSTDLQIPSLEIKGIPHDQAGKQATLFFVSGRENTLTMNGRTLKVRSVEQLYQTDPAALVSSMQSTIKPDGTVTFPAVVVPRAGIAVANYLVLAIRGDAGDVYLKNADGSCPSDMRLILKDRTCADLSDDSFKIDSSSFLLITSFASNKDLSGNAVIDFNLMER